MTIGLRDGLGRGVYTATYRVVSADGHPVSGGFAFGVGEQVTAQRGTPQVADLLARSVAPGRPSRARTAPFAGCTTPRCCCIVGAVFFRLLVWRAGRDTPRWPGRLLLGAAAIVGLLASLAGIALQGALGAGVSLGRALRRRSARRLAQRPAPARRGCAQRRLGVSCSSSSRSTATSGRAGRRSGSPSRPRCSSARCRMPDTPTPSRRRACSSPPTCSTCSPPAPGWADSCCCSSASGRGPGRGRPGAAEATARFSRLALPAIVVLVLAGTAQAWFYLGSVGRVLRQHLRLGAGREDRPARDHRRARGRQPPPNRPARARRPGTSPAQLAPLDARRGGLAVLVLGGTATLVRAAPPATLDDGPVIRELDLGPMRLQMDIEPATVGPERLPPVPVRPPHRRADRPRRSSSRSGWSSATAASARSSSTSRARARRTTSCATPRSGVAGTWEATITARVSEFDEYSAKTRFKVRR